MKELNMMCVGDKISFANFSSIFSAAGINTNVSLSAPQALPQVELQSLIRSAGTKNLWLSVPGNTVTASQIVALASAAVGAATKVDISSINSLPISTLPQIAALFSGRTWSISIDGGTSSAASAVAVINVFNDPGTARSFLALNAQTATGVDQVVAAIGNKSCSVTLDGKLSTPAAILECIGKLAGSNFQVSITNAGALSSANLNQALAQLGVRTASFSVDVLDMNAAGIMSALEAAGPNISVSISSAHALSTAELADIQQRAAGKTLSLEFNGRQLGVDPVNGDKLQKVVSASDINDTINVNTAQYPALSYLLPIIQSSGNTNLVVSYNGGQLSDTEAQGNVVLRAMEVAPASATITVISVGDGNYSVANYINIVRAAG